MKIKTNIYLNIKSLFIYNMSKILTAGMKRRATYESLVRDTILEPKDKIKLPNREASILRRTQQLSRYDDDDFLGLETINEKINKERIQQIELLKLIAQKPMGTMLVERARQSEVKSYDIGSDVQYDEDADDAYNDIYDEVRKNSEDNIRDIIEQSLGDIHDKSVITATLSAFKSGLNETDTPQEIPQEIEQSSVSRKVARNLGPEFETSNSKFIEDLTRQTPGTSSKDTPGASSSSKDVPIGFSDKLPPKDIKNLQIDMVVRRLQAAVNHYLVAIKNNKKLLKENKEITIMELENIKIPEEVLKQILDEINKYTTEEDKAKKKKIAADLKTMYIEPSIWENLIPIKPRTTTVPVKSK